MASTIKGKETAIRAITHMGLVLLSLLASCNTLDSRTSKVIVDQGRSKTVEASVQVVGPPIKTSTSRLPANSGSLVGIQFIDANHGWVGSARSLYATSNGGVSWLRLPVTVPDEAALVTFQFHDSDSGWAILQKYPEDALDNQGNEYRIMRTRDGGKSWTLQYKDSSGQLDRISFLDGKEGWAVGREFSETRTREKPLVLQTGDGGEHWTRVSGDPGLAQIHYGITDLFVSRSSGITITTMRGELFKTEGLGKVWNKIASVDGEPDQTYFGKVGQTPDARLWVLGGADSLEGTWGILAKQNADGSWTKYKTGLYLNSAIFLSEDQIVACGHVNLGLPTSNEREGVILLSSDGGSTWTTVYKDRAVRSINALDTVKPNVVWAVGGGGFIVKLEIP